MTLSKWFYDWIDKVFVDGTVNGVGRLAMFSSDTLRFAQSGNVGFYVLVMVLGIAGMVFFFAIKGLIL